MKSRSRFLSMVSMGVVSIFNVPASASEGNLRLSISLAETRESLTNGRADWREQSLGIGVNRADNAAVYLQLRHTDRFNQEDRETSAGVVLKPSNMMTVVFEAAHSDTHRVLARDAMSVQLSAMLGNGWGASTGLRTSRYQSVGSGGSSGSTSVLSNVGLERYVGHWRFAYTTYLSRGSSTPHSASHRIAVNYYLSDDVSFGVSYARGRELENIPVVGLTTARVSSVSGHAAWNIRARTPGQPAIKLTLDWGEHQQGDLYTRRGARLAARLEF